MSTVKRIALFSQVVARPLTGGAITLERLFRGMDANRYYVIFGSHVKAGNEIDHVRKQWPVPVFKLAPERQLQAGPDRFFYINNLLKTLQRAVRLRRILKGNPVDAVLATSGDLNDLPAAYLAARWSRVAYYAYVFDDYRLQWLDPLPRRYASFWEPFIMRAAANAFVPCEFLSQTYEARYGRAPVVLRDACEEINPEDTSGRWPYQAGEIRILFTGNVYHVNYDAFHNLLNALNTLHRSDIQVHIYASQTEYELFDQRITGSYIRYHPSVSEREAVLRQRQADILFLPLAFKSPIPEIVRTAAPCKMSDYLASGRPILAHAPADSFVAWYVRKHQCGLVVDRDDPQALVEAIHTLCTDAVQRRRFSENARRCARDDFSIPAVQNVFVKTMGFG